MRREQLPDPHRGRDRGQCSLLVWHRARPRRLPFHADLADLRHGGFAYGQVDAFSFSTTPTGWTAGGGVEWMFAPHWSAKAEYLYVDLSSNGTMAPSELSARTSSRRSTSSAPA